MDARYEAGHDGVSPLEGVVSRVKEKMARFDETTRVLERLGMATGSSSPLPQAGG